MANINRSLLKFKLYAIQLLVLGGLFSQACHDESEAENFYYIKDDFFHRIEESDLEKYSDDSKTGCIFAINSNEETIPIADNPKTKPVIFVTKPTEMSHWSKGDIIESDEMEQK